MLVFLAYTKFVFLILLKRITREVASSFSQRDFDKIYVLYQHLTNTSHLYVNMTPAQLKCVARIIGNSVHDLTKIWSGYISQKALKALIEGNSSIITHDHFLSRLQSGKHVVQLFSKGNIPFDMFCTIMFEACFVHKITKDENNRLIQLQNSGLSWQSCYINAGVDLVFLGDEEGKLPKRLTKTIATRFSNWC